MSLGTRLPTCGNCKQTLDEGDEWITLDGGDVWCAACWSARFGGAMAAPVVEAEADAQPGVREVTFDSLQAQGRPPAHAAAPAAQTAQQIPDSPAAEVALQAEGSVSWFYLVDGRQIGPVPAEAFMRMLQTGQADSNTMVWHEGMASWTPAGIVPVFAAVARAMELPVRPHAVLPWVNAVAAAMASVPGWRTVLHRRHVVTTVAVLGLFAAVTVSVVVAWLLVGDSPDYAPAVRRVTEKIKDARARMISRQDDLAGDLTTADAAISEYVKTLRAVDLSGCPSDFDSAYIAHMQASEALLDEVRRASGGRGIVRSAILAIYAAFGLGSASSEDVAGIVGLSTKAKGLWEEVGSTRHQVENVALRYGVTLQE